MLHLVVVVNTVNMSFRVGNFVQFTFSLVFTTRNFITFNSMTIILTSRPWPLQWRLQQTDWSVWSLFHGKRWLKHCKHLVDALSSTRLPIVCILVTFSTSIRAPGGFWPTFMRYMGQHYQTHPTCTYQLQIGMYYIYEHCRTQNYTTDRQRL